MQGGILFGLPELFFDGCLLWRANLKPLQRRVDVNGRAIKQFPSWSWTGWIGAVDTSLWSHVHKYIETGENCSLALRANIQWFKEYNESSERLAIKNSYYTEALKDATEADHERLPLNWKFSRAVPLSDHPLPPNENVWSPVLLFRSQRLGLFLGELFQRENYRRTLAYVLKDRRNAVVGLVIPDEAVAESRIGEACELISIGQGSAILEGSGVDPWIHYPDWARAHLQGIYEGIGDFGEEIRAYELQNALWVKWEDGIAYRKGLAHIGKEYWDAAGPEDIDVRLG